MHKFGPKENINNYRPISVMSSLSKILERHVSSRLLDHLCRYDLLSEWLESMDNGNLTGLLLIDFRKAFNLINHEILIKKPACYGVEGNVLEWFSSFIKDRKQSLHRIITL